MKLAAILDTNLICLDLVSEKKEDIFAELIKFACKKVSGLDQTQTLSAVLERESQQSTYLGKGLAMPHARIDSLNNFLIVCGRSKNGIKYDGIPDKIYFFVMILSCKTKINILLQTMGAFATFFSDDKNVQKIKAVNSESDFISAIEESGVCIKQTIVARDIMKTDVICLSPSQTLKEVIDLFFEKNVSGVPVLNDDGTVAGIVTEKDVINIGVPKYMSMMDNISFLSEFEPFEEIFKKEDEILVKNILSSDYTWVHEEVTVIQLAFYFVNKSCRRILVVDDKKRLKGLIMRKDLIRKVIHV